MSRRSLPSNLSRADAERIAAGFLSRRRAMHGDATMTAPAGTDIGQQQGDQQGQQQADTGQQQGAQDNGQQQTTGGGSEAKFSQADLDRIIGERLAAEKAKHDQALADAQALAGKNETEKLTIERDQAVQRATETQTKAAERVAKTEAKVAAIAAGANPQRVDAIVRNADLAKAVKDGEVDEAAVKAAVDAVLKEYPEWKATATTTASGGELNGGGGKGKPTFTRKQLEDMPPEEMAARIDEINEAIGDGRVTG